MTEPTITLTITIPEDAVRSINDFMAWSDLETFRRVLRSRDTEEASRLKYAIADIKDAINKATREVK
jgi:hypothetical protein